jgi:hypothetical protein
MTDYYYIVEKKFNNELGTFEETWRSQPFNNMRTAHHLMKLKQRGKDGNKVVYHLVLEQPKKAPKY